MTLLETLVVLAVTGLLAALAFPSLDRSVQRYAAVQARVALVADLRVARADAVRRGREVLVSLAPDGRTYAIASRHVTLPTGMRLALRGSDPIAFHPDGSASSATIMVEGPGGGQRLRVEGATGLVTEIGATR